MTEREVDREDENPDVAEAIGRAVLDAIYDGITYMKHPVTDVRGDGVYRIFVERIK